MINHVDMLVRELLIARIDEITDESQVRFQPPDADWRTYVGSLVVGGVPVNSLNVYLTDVRENRRLRSNDRTRQAEPDADGIIHDIVAARRVDCHYLISTWSPARVSPAVEPTLDEHDLLYKVIAALGEQDGIVPRQVYAPSPLPAAFPAAVADHEFPITLLPVEGYAKLAEFWGTMGEDNRLRPAVYLIVTVPVVPTPQPMGGMVTTLATTFATAGALAGADTLVAIGGRVRDSTNPLPGGEPAPVPGAWVVLETLLGQRLQVTRCDRLGRFLLSPIAPGEVRLRASSEGLGEVIRDVHVPSPGGEYDVIF